MNDFTKGDLEKILYVFDDWDSPMRHEADWMRLKNKVFDMIDNYCEHEKVVPTYGPNAACDKCGEIW